MAMTVNTMTVFEERLYESTFCYLHIKTIVSSSLVSLKVDFLLPLTTFAFHVVARHVVPVCLCVTYSTFVLRF